jgi:hypothetical protein
MKVFYYRGEKIKMNKIQKFYNDYSTPVKVTLGVIGVSAVYGIAVIKTAHGYKWESTLPAIRSENHSDLLKVGVKYNNGKIVTIPTSANKI